MACSCANYCKGSTRREGTVIRPSSGRESDTRNRNGNNTWMPRNSDQTGTNQRNCTCASDCSGSCNRSSVIQHGCNSDCSCGHNCAGCGGCGTGCGGCAGGCDGCSGSCGGSCSGKCDSGCSLTCTGSCKDFCKGSCKDACQGGCDTACTNGCGHLCNTGCRSDVALEAYRFLLRYKDTRVQDIVFKYYDPLSEEERLDEYGIIKSHMPWVEKDINKPQSQWDTHAGNDETLLDWLDAKDLKYLFGLLQEEGRRRVVKKTGKFSKEVEEMSDEEKKSLGIVDTNGNARTLTKVEQIRFGFINDQGVTPSKTQEQSLTNGEKYQIGLIDSKNNRIEVNSGDFVDDVNHIKKLNKMLIDNANKQISLSAGNTDASEGKLIKKSVGRNLIEAALDAYEDKVGIASTSDKAGKQEK